MERIFSRAIRAKKKEGKIAVIADIKPYSPKEGDLFQGRGAAEIALKLKAAGAPCLSVVTEQQHFRSSLSLLRSVAAETGLPVLCKDFITTEQALAETKEAGAAAVLLICAMQTEASLARLLNAARRLELEALVETHNAAEFTLAMKLGAQLIGINNRNILQLERDGGGVGTTEALLRQVPQIQTAAVRASACGQPKGRTLQAGNPPLFISESGIQTAEDVRRAVCAGADAVLVGTALLKAADIAACYRSLSQPPAETPPRHGGGPGRRSTGQTGR